MNFISDLSKKSITSILDKYHLEIPQKKAISWLANGEDISEEITYEELCSSSKSIAAHLILTGCTNQIIGLALRDTPSFIKCFFGCLYAGSIALPLPLGYGEKSKRHLSQIVKSANPKLIITDCTDDLKEESNQTRILKFDQLLSHAVYTPPDINIETVALLQFTSGSSEFPKGVAITHKNLSATQEMIRTSFDHKQGLIVASWLPLNHDMGLIGGLLQPLVLGGHAVLMSPFSFIKKPLRWLTLIDKYKVETSGGPNFAYDLCNKSIKQKDLRKLDLSSWRIAFCGAEPIRKDTLNIFSENLRIASFNPLSLIACYGLAEATLLISATKPGEKINTKVNFLSVHTGVDINPIFNEYVDCGYPANGCKVRILKSDAKGFAQDNEIGEILISGPNVASGYLQDGEIVNFEHKKIAGIAWHATGDLGFIDSHHLFITGRKKNLIKINGQALHAEDIEHKVSSLLPFIHNVAAFPFINIHKESMIIALELPEANQGSEKSKINLVNLCRDIGYLFGLNPFDILVVPKWGIPRTTSGKIKREKLSSLYINNEIKYIDKLRRQTTS